MLQVKIFSPMATSTPNYTNDPLPSPPHSTYVIFTFSFRFMHSLHHFIAVKCSFCLRNNATFLMHNFPLLFDYILNSFSACMISYGTFYATYLTFINVRMMSSCILIRIKPIAIVLQDVSLPINTLWLSNSSNMVNHSLQAIKWRKTKTRW